MSNLASATLSAQVQFIESSTCLELSDGNSVVFRPMRPEDVPLVLEMHDRLSADTIYFRYLHPYKPTFDELDLLARCRSDEGAAFVVVGEAQGKVVGLVFFRIDPNDQTTAQPAFLVEDRFQNKGLGHALTRLLIQNAVMKGIKVFDATVHPANRKMMRLFEQSGLPYQAQLAHGSYEVRMWLQGARRNDHPEDTGTPAGVDGPLDRHNQLRDNKSKKALGRGGPYEAEPVDSRRGTRNRSQGNGKAVCGRV